MRHSCATPRSTFAFVLALALLTNPHLFVHDAVIWTVPLALYAAFLRDSAVDVRVRAGAGAPDEPTSVRARRRDLDCSARLVCGIPARLRGRRSRSCWRWRS